MFRPLHPSPSAGSGESIPQSRYQLPTDKPDNFIHCAQCGWNKDMDVCLEGDTLQSPGISYGASVTATVKQPVYNGATGHNFSDTTIEPSFSGGCPFCGTANSRGAYIGDPFDSGVDIANL